MRKPFGKCLSLLLVVALLIQLVPTTIFATENKTSMELTATDDAMSPGYSDEFESIENAVSPATILFEEESLREESIKHFRMDDGSYIAVQYGTPVHYEEDGKWVEYDNTLHEISALNGEGISHYTVTNGDSTRVFAADANAETLLYVQYGDYALSLSPVEDPDAEIPLVPTVPEMAMEMGEISHGESADTASIGTSASVEISTEELVPATILSVASDGGDSFDDPVLADAQPDKIYSAIEYADVINGADIRYENYANTIKESIIISGPQSEYAYSFVLATEGLTPILQEDGSVLLISEDGSVPYRIPAPYMFDGNNEYSFDAYYTLDAIEDNWLFTVTANADWINAEERTFPVFLDPTVEEIADDDSDICATFIRSGYPAAVDTTDTYLYIGDAGNTNGLTRTYLHVNNLIKLPESCELYNAEISLYHNGHNYITAGKNIEVGAYPITKAGSLDGESTATQWKNWANTLTWNKAHNGDTTIDSVVIDKQTLSSATVGNYVSWDITTLAYNWYDSEDNWANKGIALKVIDETNVKSRAVLVGPRSNNSNRPCMKISYRNTRGIEEKYTYQTLSVGRAGTSYVSDYTLDNTHIVPLFSSDSTVMPFSVSLVYNTSLTGCYFSSSYADVNTQNYNNMLIGVGWKLSLQQTVKALTVGGNTYLVYTDGDGTEHYFYKDGSSYRDEDGLSLTITVSGTNYTMTNPYGDKWIFTNGYLTEQTDAYGNALYYCYNGNAYSSSSTAWKPNATGANKVTSVHRKIVGVSATEQLLKIEYSGNFISKIIGECNYGDTSAVAKRTVTLGTVDWATGSSPYKMLTSITLPDGETMQYTYYPNEELFTCRHRLKTVYDNEANYGIEYSYSYTRKVSNFYEFIMDDSEVIYGSKYHAYKRAHSQTAYRYYGKDGIPYEDSNGNLVSGDTGDDLLTIKILDNEGRTIGSYTSNSDESEILGTGAATYTENSGTSKKNNRITSSASAGIQGINLLENSSAENGTADWTNAVVNTTTHYIGRKSFTATTSTFYQTVSLSKDQIYTFSGYINVPDGTSFSSTGNIKLAFLNSSGSGQVSSEAVNYETSGINQGWIRLTVTYKAGATANYRVAVVPTGVTGSIYVDALQLEAGEAASTYNIIEDGSFEFTNPLPESTTAFGWQSSAGAIAVSTDATHFGSNYAVMSGGLDSARINQSVALNLPGNTGFILSAWAKANARPDSATAITETEKPFFSMIIRLYYSDGTSEPFYFAFDPYYSDWQYKQGIIEAKRDKDVTITHAIVVAAYDNNLNSVSFDNFSLRVEPVYSYNYNDNGDPISATGTDTGTQTGEYTGVDLTKQTAPNGNVTNYTYNDYHDVLTSTARGVTATNTYTTSGNLTETKLTATGTSKYIKTSSEISADGNDVEATYDDVGNKTTFDYHDYYGYLNAVTNAKDVITEYTYNESNGRVNQTAIDGVVGIQYTYNAGNLTQLRREFYNTGTTPLYQTYNFAYNDWDQNTSISVGNRNLVSYEYEDINASADGGGNLEKKTYANQDSVSYEYDRFDRPVKIVYNDTGKVVNNYYSADGTLAKVTYGNGTASDMNYLFEYDSSGRIVRSTQFDNNQLYQRTEHLYDEFDRLYIQRWTIDSKTRSEKYTYDDGASGDGSMTQFKTGTGHKINYTYDALRRLSNASVVNSSGQELFKTAYAYKTVSGSQTSTQVQYRNVRTTEGDLITGYKYEYDALGNITEIRQSEGSRYLLYKYVYDTQNQLVKEVHYDGTGDGDSAIKATYTYTYDTAGNIRHEKKTVATENGTAVAYEKEYSYTDGQWADLLTSVKNKTTNATNSITYDGSGNPLSYYNGTKTYTHLTWEHGRQLKSITTGGKTYNYTYDLDGNRTQKVVDGVTHTYYTLNGKVMRESFPYNGNTIIMDFCYDELGKPFSVAYSKDSGTNFTTYFYATNAQGDVEGLFRVIKNTDTNLYEQKWYGRYIYDAWGNVTVTNASGGTANETSLAVRNPLRYRGYYYDAETGFYYLQSRYYDPANHRFINADASEYSSMAALSVNGTNLFAYCQNNPVLCSDDNGEWLNIVIGAIVGAAINIVVAIESEKPIDEIFVSGICGAVGGGLTAAGFGAVAGAATSFVDSAYGNIKDVITKEKTIAEAVVDTVVNTAVGTALGAMGSGSAADIAKSNQISTAGWKAMKTIFKKTIHPVVKTTAKKAIKTAGRYIAKTFTCEVLTSVATTGVSHCVNEYKDLVYENYSTALRK